ncbi:lipoxygenase homology domain-containing protein 1-like [Tubulanus polymorphus]|uniref:lipoxygenase homology domain-containing protein 1-like n=1 Tax=Tubulanus polymorphus TaxID=672921 RepID=UPI003DA34F24
MQRSPQNPESDYSGGSGSTNYRQKLSNQNAKTVYFYKDGDSRFAALRVPINSRKYRSLDTLLADLTKKIPGLAFGVRSVFTPKGHDNVASLDGFENEGKYVCSTYKNRAKGLDVKRVKPSPPWRQAKPASGQRALNNLLHWDPDNPENSPVVRSRPARRRVAEHSNQKYNSNNDGQSDTTPTIRTNHSPKKITVIRNGEPLDKHIILLNRRTAQSFEMILDDMSYLFKMPAKRLYTIDGVRVRSLSAIFNGPNLYVICSHERFHHVTGIPTAHAHRPTRRRPDPYAGDTVGSRLRDKRERLRRTRGKWKLWVTTNELPSAGTTAHISITIYGNRGHCGPIPLGNADGLTFQNGQIDEFEISVGNIGSIYKIRIMHDDSGDFPGWFCDEVKMRDIDTDEELVFICRKWLSKDEGDGEICREIPVARRGDNVLPVLKYQVSVITGDCYNAGTDANVYMTIYGERGDSGVRQLWKAKSMSKGIFNKGQIDNFEVEAVSLGQLVKVIVGHDGAGPGLGWFLDKVIIKEHADANSHEEYVFPCGRWLDEGEDDGKLVRELKVQEEYMQDHIEREMWEYEKWKFGSQCEVMFFSKLNKHTLQIDDKGHVDGHGEMEDDHSIFTCVPRKGMIRIFSSLANPRNHLAIDSNAVTGLGRGGAYCEFRVRVQPDRSVMLESCKHNMQYINVQTDSKTGDTRGSQADPSKQFVVYCKGMLRDQGTIMLCTSLTQTIAIDHDNTLYGTGKRNRMAHFKVHKVSEDNVRMFESAVFPGQFIRLKDGNCDCQGEGDRYCHFKMSRYKDNGFITIESIASRGLFIGMTPDGRIRPTVDTGDTNVRIFPEVIEFGKRKEAPRKPTPEYEILPSPPVSHRPQSSGRKHHRTPTPKQKSPKPSTPVKPASAKSDASTFEPGDWKVWVSTADSAVNCEISMVVYSDTGNSDLISLGSTNDAGLFEMGNKDQFKINLSSLGEIFKIRLEMAPLDKTTQASWKVHEVKMQNMTTKEMLKYKFSRWLSAAYDNKELVRELPAIRPGKDSLPVVTYFLEVHTGELPGADTDANVYVQLFGEYGDTGKRLINRKQGDEFFQVGQTDKFDIEAVSLGKIDKCVVSHDGEGAGEGWYCRQIIIRETENAKSEYVFTCERWLDTSMEDKRIERILTVKAETVSEDIVDEERPIEEEAENEDAKEGEWKIWVTTGKEENILMKNEVILYAYGDSGISGPVSLGTGSDGGLFEAGNTDEFKIDLGTEIGKLYKIRIGHENKVAEGTWYIEKVKMRDLVNRETVIFHVNRWLSSAHEDCDVWRELPVVRPAQEEYPVITYVIEVQTGKEPGSDTDANIYITLNGDHGDSGKRTLVKNKMDQSKFQLGGIDVFDLDAVLLGDLKTVVIGHDGDGSGAGWYCDKVIVRAEAGEHGEILEWYFPCKQWLDEGQGDSLIERELEVQKKGEYKIWVKTHVGSMPSYGHKAFLTVYGVDGKSDEIVLHKPVEDNQEQEELFRPGYMDEFEQAFVGDVGDIFKVRLTKEDTPEWESWYIDEIKLLHKATLDEYLFSADCWLTQFEKSIKEVALSSLDLPLNNRPIRKYRVYIKFGKEEEKENAIPTTPLKLCIFGQYGDTGNRPLVLVTEEEKSEDDSKVKENEIKGDEKSEAADKAENSVDIETEDKESKENLQDAASKPIEGESKNEDDNKNDENDTGKVEDAQQKESEKNRSNKTTTEIESVLYHIEAVALGHLKRVVLMKETGDPVYIREIIIWKDENVDKEFVFKYGDTVGADQEEAEVDIELTESRPINKPAQEGEWLIWTQTGSDPEAGTNGQVIVVLCGEKGESALLPLVKSTVKDILQKDGVDQFEVAVQENIGKVFKARIGFEDQWASDSCQINTINFTNNVTKEVYSVEYDHWLKCNNEIDTWTEIPLTLSEEDSLPVLKYHVQVATGGVDNAGTDANVYIILHGERGTSGKRYLKKSLNNENKFHAGHVDEFEIEAVSLLDVNKVTIGHDGTEPGSGMFLDNVVVKEGDEWSKMFNCKRWLDAGEDDQLIERILEPAPKGHSWKVQILTGKDEGSGVKANVSMVMYGDKAHSEILNLTNEDDGGFLFENGKQDEFNVISEEDVGTLYKLRFALSGPEKPCTWFIESVDLHEEKYDQHFKFTVNQWMYLDDENDGHLEIALDKENEEERLKVNQYYVEVYTGDNESASIEASVNLQLFGARGDSGKRCLLKRENIETGRNKFERGQMDVFMINAVDLNELTKLVVSYDGKITGSGWYLDKIIIRENKDDTKRYLFLNERWLFDGSEDNLTEKTLFLTEILDDTPPTNKWKVWTKTGAGGSTTASLFMVIYGDNGVSDMVPLGAEEGVQFEELKTNEFDITVKQEIGPVYKIRLHLSGSADEVAWFLEDVLLREEETSASYSFDFSDWIRVNDESDGIVEIAVSKEKKDDMLKVKHYYVEVFTGDLEFAGSESNAHLQIFGERGDTGKRLLKKSLNTEKKFEKSQTDAFTIAAVDLRELTKIIVGHDGRGEGSGWFLHQILIKEAKDDKIIYQFDNNSWLFDDQVNHLTSAEKEIELTKIIDEDADKWKVYTYTADEGFSGTDAEVSLTVFGDRGSTSLIPLGAGSSGLFEQGQTDEFEVTVSADEVGTIQKIRIQHNDEGSASGWKLEKVVLENVKNNELKAEIPVNRWFDVTEGDGDIIREFPVTWSEEDKPLETVEYTVITHTGNDEYSGTDAQVYVILHGEKWDSGKRFLLISQEEGTRFETGKVDKFSIEAVGLGELSKLTIGHDGGGQAPGWFLDKVFIIESEVEGDEYEFICYNWLSESYGDQQIERELLPSKAPSKYQQLEDAADDENEGKDKEPTSDNGTDQKEDGNEKDKDEENEKDGQ